MGAHVLLNLSLDQWSRTISANLVKCIMGNNFVRTSGSDVV